MWWLQFPTVIDEATQDDTADMSAIHGDAFKRAWSDGEIAALLRDDAVLALVARRSSLFSTHTPVGFVIARKAAEEAEVLTVAVRPGNQRRGIGQLLIENLLRRLYADRIAELFLEVDIGNHAAVALYRKIGFREIGERTGYYHDPSGNRSSALVMRRDLR